MRTYISVAASAIFTVAVFMVFKFILQGGLAQGEGRPRDPIGIPRPAVASKMHLQPLGTYPIDDAVALSQHYKQKFGLDIDVLDPMPIPDTAFDPNRGQAVAERLIDQIRTAHVLDRDPQSIVIGLTTADMYIASLDWRYAFNLRSDGHLAVVSIAVMQERGADHELVMRRLQKMVTKNIGVLYYGLDLNDDPGSVLYRNVGGNRELDSNERGFLTRTHVLYLTDHASGVPRRALQVRVDAGPEHAVQVVAQPVHGLRPSLHLLFRARVREGR